MADTVTPQSADLSFADLDYRCVCGAAVQLHPRSGGTCPECGRHYCPSLFEENTGGETILVSQCDKKGQGGFDQDEQAQALVGATFGHYKIVELLGKGGMGSVYRALDESLQRYVALKVLHETELSEKDSPQVQQLFQEARAQARVNHPNVVHIYYVGKSGNSPFFAMELIGGPTLARRLMEGPLPFREVSRIATQITDALKHAAKYDIVHGDIKPSNILQVDPTHVKLSDFGLARRLIELAAGSGRPVGTPNYISPEAASGEPTDFRSDMYCLGVALFELTFGKLPYQFDSTDVMSRYEAHRSGSVEFPAPWPESVPVAWKEVLSRLLEKRPEDRYQDYDELLRDLRRVQPVELPSAGRLQRGLAWLVDITFAFGAQAILAAPLAMIPSVEQALSERPPLHMLAALSTFLVPVLILLFQCRLGQTIGKRLFQIRVVDCHGLPPAHPVMAARSVFQFLPVWGVGVTHLMRALSLDWINPLVMSVCFAFVLTEMIVTFFTQKRRSLHDMIFGTQVVLDAGDAFKKQSQ